ncbi:hypothetical protein [Rhabdaerophilum sp.]|uniref:hypothetical protein n=1 Tax=Rhabdaerophilum sp. TaxID=2717341 RepID=UPI0038D4F2DB
METDIEFSGKTVIPAGKTCGFLLIHKGVAWRKSLPSQVVREKENTECGREDESFFASACQACRELVVRYCGGAAGPKWSGRPHEPISGEPSPARILRFSHFPCEVRVS